MKFVYSLMGKVETSDVVNGVIEAENIEIAKLAIDKYLKKNNGRVLAYLRPIDSSIDFDFVVKAMEEYTELHYKKFYVTFVEGGYGTYKGKDIIHALQRCCPGMPINRIKSWEEVV